MGAPPRLLSVRRAGGLCCLRGGTIAVADPQRMRRMWSTADCGRFLHVGPLLFLLWPS